MFFTQEDYIKIQQWLVKNSVKDTEFNEANIPFNGEETITIVQGNQNKKVFLKDLIAQVFNLGISDFVNITDKYDAPNISLEEAIRLIPSRARKEGQVITFLDREDHWHIYQFKGVLNQWNVLDTWEDLFDFNINNFIIDSILPDEEDLTKSEPDTNGNSYLSLKDREYNPEDFSGLGRIIFRKNIVDIEDPIYGKVKKNVLYQDMFTQSNTIYEIRYDFDLNGQEITIPEGCVLDFQGGSLNNGTLTGTFTITSIDRKIFNNITLTGKLLNEYIHVAWFGAISDANNMVDCTKEIQSAIDNAVSANVNKVKLNTTYYKISDTLHIPVSHFSLGAEPIDIAFPMWEYNKFLAGFVMIKNKPILQLDVSKQIYLNNISFMTDNSFEDDSKDKVYGIYSDYSTGEINFGENYFINLRFFQCTYGIYNRMLGYKGWTLNTFKNIAFNDNKIGIYIHSIKKEGVAEKVWMNHNIIDSCAFAYNTIGGMKVDVGIVETTEIKNCTFEQNGSDYTYNDYITYGAFGFNITAGSGKVTLKKCYFEGNYAYRKGTPQTYEKIFNGTVTPSEITRQEGHIIVSGIVVELISNIIANAFQVVSLSNGGGVITKDNEWYFTYTDSKTQKAIVTLWRPYRTGLDALKLSFEEIYVRGMDSLFKYAPNNNPETIEESLLVGATIQSSTPGFNYIDIEGYNFKEKACLYINSTSGNDLNTGLLPTDAWKTIHNLTTQYGKNLDTVTFKIAGEFNDIFNTTWKNGASYYFYGNDCLLTMSKNSNSFVNSNLEFHNITFNINAQNYWIVFYFINCNVIFKNCIFNLDSNSNYYDLIRYSNSNVLFESCTFNKTSTSPEVRIIPAENDIVSGIIKFVSCINNDLLYVRTSTNLNVPLFNIRSVKSYKSLLFNEEYNRLCQINNYSICNLDGSLVSKKRIIHIASDASIEDIQNEFRFTNTAYKIVKDIDLKGGTLNLKEATMLEFSDNAKFTNGTVNLNYCSITPIVSISARFPNIIGQISPNVPFIENGKIIMYGSTEGVKVDFEGNNIIKQGTTSDRPSKFVKEGFQYFDTTLGKPIYAKSVTEWGSVSWVDATGADV